jgi:hypothetical protein
VLGKRIAAWEAARSQKLVSLQSEEERDDKLRISKMGTEAML